MKNTGNTRKKLMDSLHIGKMNKKAAAREEMTEGSCTGRLRVMGRTHMDTHIESVLIRNTTREERERIVADSIGNIDGLCDGCAAGLAEMYQDYIDGKKEIREINMEFSARR